jgi:DNA-binding LacI/PurR family transcriptional regulator
LEVSDRLRELAYQRGPEAKLPTVRQLCDSLGTSVATLDNALDELEQQRIIYRVQGSGIYVSPRVNYRHIAVAFEVGFYQNVVASPFWGMLWALLINRSQERAAIRNEEFSFHLVSSWDPNADGLPIDLVDMVESGRVDGIIGIGIVEPAADWLRAHGPYVGYAGPADHQILGDGDAGDLMGVRALAEQGCRRIGFWKPAEANRPHHEDPPDDVSRFGRALAEAGLSMDESLVRNNLKTLSRARASTRQTHQEQGYSVAMEVFGDPARLKPDGLVIGDDMMTSGALAAFQRLGVRVGVDVRIATQANMGSPTLFGYENVLTRMVYDPAECVDTMLALLERVMDDETDAPELTMLRPQVILPGNMPSPVTHALIET